MTAFTSMTCSAVLMSFWTSVGCGVEKREGAHAAKFAGLHRVEIVELRGRAADVQ